jgi:flagellum-specific ATP synthase
LERSGTSDKGSITGLYTVLVEGDDMNEPIADTVRGIVDGHIVLSRRIANTNHYPPVDIMQSVSRVMPDIVSKDHYKNFGNIRSMMAVYREAQDLINIGAYQKGANPEIDEAVRHYPAIQAFLRQAVEDKHTFEEILDMMAKICNM